MAPDTIIKQAKMPKISLWYARIDVPILELYFKTWKCSNESLMLESALQNCERKILEKFLQEEVPDTFRKFKFRLYKMAEEEAIKEILINRQKIDEPTTQWLSKIIHLIEAFKSKDKALFYIKETSLYPKSKTLIEKYIEKCDNCWEMKNKINLEIRAEECNEPLERKTIRKPIIEKVKRGKIKENQIQEKKEMNQIKITEQTTKDEDKIYITISNEKYPIIEDKGSDVNVISKKLVDKNNLKIQKINKTQLRNIVGLITETEEVINITTTINGVIMNLRFLVVETESLETILIGKETLKRLDLQKKELNNLKTKFPKVFDMEPSEGYAGTVCEIKTIGNKKTYIKQRRIPQALQEGSRVAIEKMLKNGIIELSSSSWCNPIRPVAKENGEVRITVNMQFLNNMVENNNYTVPHIQQIIEKTQGNRWFTIIDLKDGYFQIKLDPEDKHKTAFHFNNKLYQFVRMPQGFKNSPAIFQQIMDKVLMNEMDKGCNVYLDDIVIYGKSEEEHDKILSKVLKILETHNFKINLNKIQYKQNEVKLLGAVIDGITQRPIPDKQAKILEFNSPKQRNELQRFLGFANYYKKYLKEFASISEPLYNQLRGKSETLVWTEKEEKAFCKIKEMINNNIAVHIPDYSKDFVLSTDASNAGISAVLQQEYNGELKVINWGSKILTPAEKKYGITEKEFLAMAWGIEHFDYYLRARKFKVRTDHSALLSSRSKEIFGSLRLERMRERLQEYDFTIEYIKGKDLIEADVISRIAEEPKEYTEFEKRSKNLLSNSETESECYWKLKNNEIKIIPKINNRINLIKTSHEVELGHRGRDATMKDLLKSYYWPNMQEMVNEFIKSCECCQRNTQKTEGGESFVSSKYPGEYAAIDIFFLTQKHAILTYIDYYTRMAKAKTLNSKEPKEIVKKLKEIFEEIGTPKTLISDNGKEFVNFEVRKLLIDENIEHHRTSVEKHQSNGRIERFHRTLWQLLRKKNTIDSDVIENCKEKIEEAVEQYNKTFHSSIQMSPNDAKENPKSELLQERNHSEGSFSKKFNKTYRETFKIGDEVWVKATAVLSQEKINPLFNEKAKVVRIMGNDSYLIKILKTQKIVKKNHSQLVKIL